MRALGMDMASSTSWEVPTMPLLAPSEHMGSAKHGINVKVKHAGMRAGPRILHVMPTESIMEAEPWQYATELYVSNRI